MNAIRIKKNNTGNNNNKKIGMFIVSICLFVIVIIGLVLWLGLKTKNVNSDPSHIGRNNLIEIKNTSCKNYYNDSFSAENFLPNIEQDGLCVKSDFNINYYGIYLNEFNIYQESTKKSFYLNENDEKNKTNGQTVTYKYEFSNNDSTNEYFYINNFFVNGG